MASSGTGDEIEILGYFTGFWLFIFNAGFRNAWLADFRSKGAFARVLSLFDAAFSILFGVLLPAALVAYLFMAFGSAHA